MKPRPATYLFGGAGFPCTEHGSELKVYIKSNGLHCMKSNGLRPSPSQSHCPEVASQNLSSVPQKNFAGRSCSAAARICLCLAALNHNLCSVASSHETPDLSIQRGSLRLTFPASPGREAKAGLRGNTQAKELTCHQSPEDRRRALLLPSLHTWLLVGTFWGFSSNITDLREGWGMVSSWGKGRTTVSCCRSAVGSSGLSTANDH